MLPYKEIKVFKDKVGTWYTPWTSIWILHSFFICSYAFNLIERFKTLPRSEILKSNAFLNRRHLFEAFACASTLKSNINCCNKRIDFMCRWCVILPKSSRMARIVPIFDVKYLFRCLICCWLNFLSAISHIIAVCTVQHLYKNYHLKFIPLSVQK